jgi:predicted aconitase
MLDGKAMEAVRIAMSILADLGDAVEAEKIAEIVHVHTDSGFYLDENRKAEVLIKCQNLAENILTDSSFYPLLGYLAGHKAGNKVIA